MSKEFDMQSYKEWRRKGLEYQLVTLDNGYTCQRSQLFIALQYLVNSLQNSESHNNIHEALYLRNTRVMMAMGLTSRMFETIQKTLIQSGIAKLAVPAQYGRKAICAKYWINIDRYLQLCKKYLPKDTSKKEISKINETYLPIRLRITMFETVPSDVDCVYIYNGKLSINRPTKILKRGLNKCAEMWTEIAPHIFYYAYNARQEDKKLSINNKQYSINNIYSSKFDYTFKNISKYIDTYQSQILHFIKIHFYTWNEIKDIQEWTEPYNITQMSMTKDMCVPLSDVCGTGVELYDVIDFKRKVRCEGRVAAVYKECSNVFSSYSLPVPVHFASNSYSVGDAVLGYALAVCDNPCVIRNQQHAQYLRDNGQYIRNTLRIKVKKSKRTFTVYATGRQYTQECSVSSRTRKQQLYTQGIKNNFDLHSAVPATYKLYNTHKFDVQEDLKDTMLKKHFKDVEGRYITKDTLKELQMRFLFTQNVDKCWARYSTACARKGKKFGIGSKTQIVSKAVFYQMWDCFFESTGSKKYKNVLGPCIFLLESTLELAVFKRLQEMGISCKNVYDCFYYADTQENIQNLVQQEFLGEFKKIVCKK